MSTVLLDLARTVTHAGIARRAMAGQFPASPRWPSEVPRRCRTLRKDLEQLAAHWDQV